MEIFENFIDKNGLIVGFLVIGVLAFLSEVFSKKVLKGYLPGSAIAILAGLILAYFGGVITNGEKGLSDLPFLKGLGVFGGSMFRDFTIVATAMGASYLTMKKAGWLGLVSLLFGIVFFFVFGTFCLLGSVICIRIRIQDPIKSGSESTTLLKMGAAGSKKGLNPYEG
jgi:malonate transporter MadM subunit